MNQNSKHLQNKQMSIRHVLQDISYGLKIYDAFLYLNKQNVPILMYHRFSRSAEHFKISQGAFENQLRELTKWFTFVSLNQYVEHVKHRNCILPDYPIILTIDDGYEDNYHIAYPILKKFEIPAAIFLVTDFISHGRWLWGNKIKYITRNAKKPEFDFPVNNEVHRFSVRDFRNWHRTILKIFHHCRTLGNDEKENYIEDLAKHLGVDVPEKTVDEFKPMTWVQIEEMSRNGIVFGSHTCSHPILTRITQEELRSELSQSKKEIENRLGVSVDHFCYPNGAKEDFNDNTIKLLDTLSYSSSVTTMPGYNTTDGQDMFALRRMAIYTDDKKRLKHAFARQSFY